MNYKSISNRLNTSLKLSALKKRIESGQVKVAVFDFDGVVATTLDFHFDSWIQAFSNTIGINSVSLDTLIPLVNGKPSAVGAENVLRIAEETKSDYYGVLSASQKTLIQNISEEKDRIYLRLVDKHPEKVKLIDHVKELLSYLAKHNVIMTVASSDNNAGFLLKKLGLINFFHKDAIVTGNDVGKHSDLLKKKIEGKPSPDPFLEACLRVNINPTKSSCIAFEDSSGGIEAIAKANIFAIGLDSEGSGHLSKENYSDVVLNALSEML